MISKPPLFVRKATGLTREISALSMIPLSWLTIGAGINVFAVQASYSFPGANVPLGYVMCGVFYVMFTAILGLMAVAMPRTAGDYVYTGRMLGPFAGIFTAVPRLIGISFIGGLLGALTCIYVGLGMLQTGILTNNPGLIATGGWILGSKEVQFELGLLFVFIAFLVLLLGSRVFMWAAWIFMAVPLVGSLIGMGLCYTNTPATASVAWDSMFGSDAWNEIVEVAKANGWTAAEYGFGVNWDSTFKIFIPAYFAYGGSELPVYFGSEVKEPRKSMLVGGIVGPLLILIFYGFFVCSVYYCFGPFLSQCSFVMMGGYAEQLTMTPELPIGYPTFAGVLAPPWLVFLIAMTSALWMYGVVIAILGMTSKTIFAMSFDRFVPESLAAVNDRFHSPHWALLLTLIVSIIGLAIFLYYGALATIINTTIMWLFWRAFACISGVIYPLTRPEIWERGHALRVAGVPLISILGTISFFVSMYVITAAITEAVADVLYLAIGVWTFALIYYVAYALYNRRRGIEVEAIYREIPPA